MKHIGQLGIALFGFSAMYCALHADPQVRMLAPFLGVAGQPFWLVVTWRSRSWGMFAISIGYTFIYCKALYDLLRAPPF